MNVDTRPKNRLNRWLFRIIPMLALLIALLVALFLISGVQRESQDALLDNSYVWVLIVTVFALLVLVWTIFDRLVTLAGQVRAGRPGALLSARWVRNFLLLSLPPALIVFFFSAYFLTRTIDSWFDVQVESALEDSLRLGRQFLDTRKLEVRNQLRETADGLLSIDEGGEPLRRELLQRVRASGPSELTVLETDGTLVATADINAVGALPERPADFAILQASQQGEYAAAEPTPDGLLQIRVIRLVPPRYPGDSPRLLQAVYPLPADITDLTGSIENEYYRYQNVNYLRQSLKQSFILILSLVLLLTVLLAILAALYSARRMVSPLSKLARATREVASGDLGQAVTANQRDEIGFLVSSFNSMTQALKKASLQAEASRAELQAQGDYLEAVLGNLSSGVMTLDDRGRIVTINASFHRILQLSRPAADRLADSAAGPLPLEELAGLDSTMQPFADAVKRQFDRSRAEWQQEIRIERTGTPLALLARGARLPSPESGSSGGAPGHVVVFDDVTVLDRAQREAAWAEAARRLAHEVKNPLTPIRLATERLELRLGDKLEGSDAELLSKASRTIVAQVEALRKLVDAFGDYAREPETVRKPVRLDELVREVVTLYQQGENGIRFELDLEHGPDGLQADDGRLRQMLHNLIRNADEAGGDDPVILRISSNSVKDETGEWLELELCDDGPGFPATVLEKPFEPYVTDKGKGRGLGLAICRKVVTEHDGSIEIGNLENGGARIVIRLPLD